MSQQQKEHIHEKAYQCIYNFLLMFSEWHMTKLNGVKNAIMQMTYFLIDDMFNLLFYYHIIFCIVRKWLLMRNLATILPL